MLTEDIDCSYNQAPGRWEDALDFIKDNTCGLVDLVDTDSGSKDHQCQDYPVVGKWEKEDIVILDTLGLVGSNLVLVLRLGLEGDSGGGWLLLRSYNRLLFLGHRRRGLDWRLGTLAPRTSHGGSRVSI